MDENRARVILKNSGMLAGRSTAKLTGVALIRGAQTVVMLSILQAITTAFNWLFWPDEEDQLADEVRSKPHIIFGKDGNGKILYWESYDAATELLSWVGMDKWVKQFKGIKDGKVQDVVWDVMLAPINQTYGLWNPLLGKYATEVMLGKTGWPKIQDPRPIRDKLEYGAGIFGLVPEYRLLAGKPSEGYLKDRGKSLLVKRADTGQVAYYQANELVEDFLDKINKGKAYAEPDTPNARKKRDALYNLKLAIRYHDEDAQQKYGRLYTELGGTFKGLQQSIKMSHPLAAIPKKMQAAFLEGLSEDQGKTVARAVEWYGRIYGE